MRPIIETIKSDKTIDENFESIKGTLCGNVSLDNMNVRILEGVTQDSDLQNLVIHSGSTRPVLCIPLIGDVYFQEISDKYIDIRSTKPQVAYKVLIMFGPAITNATLKEVGGPGYKDTDTITTETVIQEISYIEEVVVQYKPLALRSSILPNPCAIGGPPTNTYNRVLAGSENFYVIGSAGQILWRINRTTGTVDYIDFTATCATRDVVDIYNYGSHVYVLVSGDTGTATSNIYEVDTATFAVTDSWLNIFPGESTHKCSSSLFVDGTYMYYLSGASTDRKATLVRVTKSSGAISQINLITSGAGQLNYLGDIIYVPASGTTNGALFVIVDNNYKAAAEIFRVDIIDATTAAPLFTLTDTLTSTSAFSAHDGIFLNGYVHVPVQYSQAHDTNGGTVTYCTGIVKINTTTPYTFTFVPVSIPYTTYFLNTIISDGTYIYIVFPQTNLVNGPMAATIVLRYDPTTSEVINFFTPVASTGVGSQYMNSFACNETDGSLLFIRNPASGDYSNFEFSTIDFTDYE